MNPNETRVGEVCLKILHTADVHLNKKKPESLQTLKLIVEFAKNHNIDIITIGGDLFDSPEDADALRTRIRQVFSNIDFPVIAIPGNHDEHVFQRNLDFGTKFHALTTKPAEYYPLNSHPNVNIVGVPFTAHVSEDLLLRLKTLYKPESINILLIHCTLDISFSEGDFGEKERVYCEIDKPTLSALGYEYILAGHFHTKFDLRELGDSCKFVYPGSPVSLTWKELGERSVAILDTETKTLESYSLENSYFRDILSVEVTPGKEMGRLEEISDWILNTQTKNGEFSIIVNGYGIMDESTFSEELEKIRSDLKIKNNYVCVSEIFENPLFRLFQEEIQRNPPKTGQKALEQVVIRAMRPLMRREE